MAELCSLREGRFERVDQSLENLCALVDQLHSRLELIEDAGPDSPAMDVGGHSVSTHSGVRPEPKPFQYSGQMRAFGHMAAELNTTRRRAREIEQVKTARSSRAPSIGPGATTPLSTPAVRDGYGTSIDTNRVAERNLTPLDANFGSETQALPHVPGSMRPGDRVLYVHEQDCAGAACGSREPNLSFDPRWSGYQPVHRTAQSGTIHVRTLHVTPFGKPGPTEPRMEPVHTMIQDFSFVADYWMYRLDNVSTLFTSGEAG